MCFSARGVPLEPESPVRNRFDQLGKQIGQRALKLFGTTVAHDEIAPMRSMLTCGTNRWPRAPPKERGWACWEG